MIKNYFDVHWPRILSCIRDRQHVVAPYWVIYLRNTKYEIRCVYVNHESCVVRRGLRCNVAFRLAVQLAVRFAALLSFVVQWHVVVCGVVLCMC